MAQLNTLDVASEGHDEKVCDWKDTLKKHAFSSQNVYNFNIFNTISPKFYLYLLQLLVSAGLPLPSSVEQTSTFNISEFGSFGTPCQPFSPEAPPFSPITPQASLAQNESSLCVSTLSSALSGAHMCNSVITSTPCPQNPAPSFSVLPLLPTSSPVVPEKWAGFKIVIDNIDMNIRPRYQTFERQTKSIHYVNAYAVRDRIDLSCSSSTEVNSEVSIDSHLPDDNDRENILANFVILVGRILCELIPALKDIPNLSTQRILHQFTKEMDTKSEIVSRYNAGAMHHIYSYPSFYCTISV